jgi:hypothetical protein
VRLRDIALPRHRGRGLAAKGAIDGLRKEIREREDGERREPPERAEPRRRGGGDGTCRGRVTAWRVGFVHAANLAEGRWEGWHPQGKCHDLPRRSEQYGALTAEA